MQADRNTEFVTRRLVELDALLVEWDDDFGDVDLDRDEAALEAALQRLDEIERRQMTFRYEPRYQALCAEHAALN